MAPRTERSRDTTRDWWYEGTEIGELRGTPGHVRGTVDAMIEMLPERETMTSFKVLGLSGGLAVIEIGMKVHTRPRTIVDRFIRKAEERATRNAGRDLGNPTMTNYWPLIESYKKSRT